MARIYYDLIASNKTDFTLDRVPKRWRAEVEQMLKDDNKL